MKMTWLVHVRQLITNTERERDRIEKSANHMVGNAEMHFYCTAVFLPAFATFLHDGLNTLATKDLRAGLPKTRRTHA